MALPADFQFSQSSLQDFVDCPRRFQLRYLWDVAWPAVAAEPIEEHERRIQHGVSFHRMVQQHLLGLPEDALMRMADGDLARWWAGYRAYRPADLPGARYPEMILTATVAGYRMVAKYDLLVVQPGERAVILDWKTSQKRSSSAALKLRLQTRVYRYLLVRAGAHYNGGAPLAPEQVEMRYWFAEFPESVERLPYAAAQFDEDARTLTELITQIAALGDADFPLTSDERRCQYCLYRSYCERGVQAGQMDAMEDEDAPATINELSFDFEQIAEIAF